jgi:hypothetical protein
MIVGGMIEEGIVREKIIMIKGVFIYFEILTRFFRVRV